MGVCALHTHNPPLAHRTLRSVDILLEIDTPLSLLPENVLLSHPIAKIGDFGLSQFAPFPLKAGKGVTFSCVNPRWTAPEILRGHPYTIQANVYSLGLLMWEIKHRAMAYGEVGVGPFQMEEMREAILSGVRPPVCAGDPYDDLCAECWAENPLFRPDANEVVERLLRIIEYESPLLYASVCHSPRFAESLPCLSIPLFPYSLKFTKLFVSLRSAATHGDIHTLQSLLSGDVDVNEQSEDGVWMLKCVIFQFTPSFACLLVDGSASIVGKRDSFVGICV